MVPDDVARRAGEKRWVSGFKGLGFMAGKHGLARTLERARSLAGRRVTHELFDFAPRSFVFPEGFHAWRVRAEDEPDTLWISKVGDSARGEGVHMVTDLAAVRPAPNLVLQEYIATPHLIDGFKYTLRVYVAITSLDPLRVWVFPDGLTKLTTRPFTLDRASLGDRFVHLTNPTVLREDKGADLASKRMTHVRYRERLRRDGFDDAALFRAIHAMVAKTMLAVREPMIGAQSQAGLPAEGAFVLVGLDVLVDQEMRPWLIEVNMGPSLAVDAAGESESARAEKELKARVVAGLLTILGVCPDGPPLYEPVFPSLSMFDWLPAYEEIHPSDVADLRAVCEREGFDPRVTVDEVAIERDTPEELVVIHARHDHRIELNATAGLIWRCLARGDTVSETVRAVERQDGPASAQEDVWETLARFVQLGVWTVRE
jgi:tubulin polyglutamylase TTLL5